MRHHVESEAGFSLIELLLAMVIAVEILVAALTVFDVHNKMSRVQMQITEVQQAVRVAQYDIVRTTRMAGRGALNAFFAPVDTGTTTFFAGQPLEVRNNLVDDLDREVARGFANTPLAVPGTDLLVVRGCLSGLLLQMDPSAAGDFEADPAGDTPGIIDNGTVTLWRNTLHGREQSLEQLRDPQFFDPANNAFSPLVLQSAIDRARIAIVEVTGVALNVVGGVVMSATLNVNFLPNDDTPVNPMVGLADPEMAVGFACVLEEYRYYVRENFSIPGDDTSDLLPRLSRARMIPGTETPWRSDVTNLSLDLADEIIDLQVALAIDTDFDADGGQPGAFNDDSDTLGNDDVLYEGLDDDARGADDWLFNSSEDDALDPVYVTNITPSRFRPAALLAARITLVGRSQRPDPGYIAPDFDPVVDHDWVEDNDYDAAPALRWKQGTNRNHRRRVLQTVVDLRNF